MTHTHVTAPTRFVEVNGTRYAYRRFGDEQGAPLIFLQHFRGGMDHWDPRRSRIGCSLAGSRDIPLNWDVFVTPRRGRRTILLPDEAVEATHLIASRVDPRNATGRSLDWFLGGRRDRVISSRGKGDPNPLTVPFPTALEQG